MHSEADQSHEPQPTEPALSDRESTGESTPTTESTTDRAGAPGTGVPEVDEVLTSLEGLEDSPPAEHVTVFERAHDRLRRALDTRQDG